MEFVVIKIMLVGGTAEVQMRDLCTLTPVTVTVTTTFLMRSLQSDRRRIT